MGDSSYGPPAGYALRKNGTCSANQETCGNPWGDWYNCCPGGTHCGDDNTCCPTESGCVDFLKEDLHCANNKTWDLYQSEDSYFCCLNTARGFLAGGLEYNGSSTTGIGCADGLPDGKDDEALVPVARGNATESSAPGSSGVRNSGAESRPQSGSYSATESSTNTGAIAGGVVGGCAGLALIIALVWFLLRRRRQQAETAPLMSPDVSTPVKEKKGLYGSELEDNAIRAELQGDPNAMAHELPPTSMAHELPPTSMAHELPPNTTPHELPASPTRY